MIRNSRQLEDAIIELYYSAEKPTGNKFEINISEYADESIVDWVNYHAGTDFEETRDLDGSSVEYKGNTLSFKVGNMLMKIVDVIFYSLPLNIKYDHVRQNLWVDDKYINTAAQRYSEELNDSGVEIFKVENNIIISESGYIIGVTEEIAKEWELEVNAGNDSGVDEQGSEDGEE